MNERGGRIRVIGAGGDLRGDAVRRPVGPAGGRRRARPAGPCLPPQLRHQPAALRALQPRRRWRHRRQRAARLRGPVERRPGLGAHPADAWPSRSSTTTAGSSPSDRTATCTSAWAMAAAAAIPFGNGQNPNVLLGKILRIDVDGQPDGRRAYALPPDNPFGADGTDPGGGLPEIWALGLRNPWRFSFDPENGDLYIGDVGQGAYEEIDRQPGDSRRRRELRLERDGGRHCYGGRLRPDRLREADRRVRPRLAAARSPAATSTAARRSRSWQAPTSSPTTARASSSPSQVGGGTSHAQGRCSPATSAVSASEPMKPASSTWPTSAAAASIGSWSTADGRLRSRRATAG